LRPEYIAKYYRASFGAVDIALDGARVLEELRVQCESVPRVFVDLDCDVFEPASFPAVAHTRPFGIDPLFVLRVLDVIGRDKLVGLAISEFEPSRDHHDRCAELLMWLIEYVLLWKHEK